MTNNKQQTVVDRIVNLLNKEGFSPVLIEEEIKSFKEMEKEQILDAYECGFESEHDARIPQSSMRYYEQTYGGGEQ